MEAAKEQEGTGLLDKILPPRLEDAGLEDCALPPDSIQEAFLRAAGAVKSRAATLFGSSDDETDGLGDCVSDPWPTANGTDTMVGGGPPSSASSDVVVGVSPGKDAGGPCLAGKGAVEEGGDAVVVGGGSPEEERQGERGCVDDGVKGLETNGKAKGGEEEEEGDDREHERPILVEGFV